MIARGRLSACSAVLALLFGTGCTTMIQGSPQVSICAKYELANCSEYIPVQPKKGHLVDVWKRDQKRAANMLCSALSQRQITKFLGNSYYRYIANGKACRIAAKKTGDVPQRLLIQASLYFQSMAGYRIVPGNKRVTVAGHPAWLIESSSSSKERYAEYTLSTTRSPNKGGVLFVRVAVRRAPGDYTQRPLDYSLLKYQDEIAKAFIKAVL